MAVDKLVDSTQLDSDLTSVANAIRTKGGTNAQLAFPNGFVSAIGDIPTGGGSTPVEKKQVNFIDYDGTILHSYTYEEANALTSLPENPSHTGLTAQGWNWTLEQIKTQLTAMPTGDVWVGQMYITSSGNTEIDVYFADSTRLEPTLTIAVNGTVTVDWGDNTTPDTVTGTSLNTTLAVPHTYTNKGYYTITISVVSGIFTFYCSPNYSLLRKNSNATENRVYAKCIKHIRIGNGITEIKSIYGCISLKDITIPKSITSISQQAFQSCESITCVIFPNTLTTIANTIFYSDVSLIQISIPYSITSIGSQVFQGCTCFSGITIPNGVTSIGSSLFQGCAHLSSVEIPDGVTSIPSGLFANCGTIESITIPSDVTSIGNNAFVNCHGVKEYHIKPTTVPTGGTTMFLAIVSDCVIYVPASKLEDYKTASNWSAYASYMQGE